MRSCVRTASSFGTCASWFVVLVACTLRLPRTCCACPRRGLGVCVPPPLSLIPVAPHPPPPPTHTPQDYSLLIGVHRSTRSHDREALRRDLGAPDASRVYIPCELDAPVRTCPVPLLPLCTHQSLRAPSQHCVSLQGDGVVFGGCGHWAGCSKFGVAGIVCFAGGGGGGCFCRRAGVLLHRHD